jgi:hypothetical protein
MKIKITDEDFEKCMQFAHDSVSTNMQAYKRRNQGDQNKVISDIGVGKVAEIAVHEYLTNVKKVKCTYPDFAIYGKNQKSYECDLKTDKYRIHVKSQDHRSAARYGASWQFQKNDSLTHAPENDELIVLCIVRLNEVEIKRVVSAASLVGKYGEPLLERLRDTKLTLYFDSI